MQDLSCGVDQDGTCIVLGFGVLATTLSDSSHLSIRPQVIHARSGVPYEIMGVMQGKVSGTSLVIVDSFALPVQGTETRVNAANEANEYMVEYVQGNEKVRCPFHSNDPD